MSSYTPVRSPPFTLPSTPVETGSLDTVQMQGMEVVLAARATVVGVPTGMMKSGEEAIAASSTCASWAKSPCAL